ncbi:hypothetical protein FCM35_KLT19148 [Carex littledalei]|uniref:Uncharacterized protein n=1 Tax=Carex littledalei TaxID=544730 RepID=A0A833RDK5_9POAL|nr:hypothetical protein FCM35_KLT19148 [Carex littledalei]
MSSSLVPQKNPSKPNIYNFPLSAPSHRVNIKWPVITINCASQLRSMPMVVVRAEQVPTTAIPQDHEQGNLDDDKRGKWLLGSVLVFFPFYKNFLQIEDKIEKTATTVLNVVESVAETVDKVAEDVQQSLPENSNIRKVAHIVEKIAEEVDKDAEVLESFVEKV